MAERALSRTDAGNTSVITWTGLANGDTGEALVSFDHADMSAQLQGTFGVGGSVTLQGSNDGTNWYALTDPQGNAITKTAAGLEQVTEITKYVRPSVTAGDGTTALAVVLFMRRGR